MLRRRCRGGAEQRGKRHLVHEHHAEREEQHHHRAQCDPPHPRTSERFQRRGRWYPRGVAVEGADGGARVTARWYARFPAGMANGRCAATA
ncbi:hypothetical protein GCM10027174_41400 [Salinifilum aidingensis]